MGSSDLTEFQMMPDKSFSKKHIQGLLIEKMSPLLSLFSFFRELDFGKNVLVITMKRKKIVKTFLGKLGCHRNRVFVLL